MSVELVFYTVYGAGWNERDARSVQSETQVEKVVGIDHSFLRHA